MEDVLQVYQQESQEKIARICFDERPCQLLDEVLAPLPMKEGKPQRQHSEYERKGTACVLLAYDIDVGRRYVQVRETRTKKDYAEFIDWLVKQHFSQTDTIHLVQDNLNTHAMSSFYEHLPLQRAGELARKIQFHFTPKHGSWLNMAEIEFSALARQCLDRRIKAKDILEKEVLAWTKERNEQAVKIHWSFTVDKARISLKSKYEKINPDNKNTPNN
jgi:hypothetical protein